MSAAPDLIAVPDLRSARLGDVESMAAMINRFAAQGLMLPKSTTELSRSFREYLVLTGPDGVAACAGLRVYSPDLAEIVGLAVDEGWQGRGLGSRLVAQLVEEAKRLSIKRLFAMALKDGFFHPHGFRTVPREWLPEKIAADCRGCSRRSGCNEIAVLLDLDPGAAPLGAPRSRARRKGELKVIPRATRRRG